MEDLEIGCGRSRVLTPVHAGVGYFAFVIFLPVEP